MRIQLTFKTPDVVDNAIIDSFSDIKDKEARDNAIYAAKQAIRCFVRNDEYCTIEVDTESRTANVVRAR